MLPEISRRCLDCGAAVRAGARFCPQCGRKMGDDEAEADGVKGAAEDAAPVVPSVAEARGETDAIELEESWRLWEEGIRHAHAASAGESGSFEDSADREAQDDEVGMSALPPPPPEPDAPVASPAPGRADGFGARGEDAAAASALHESRPEVERKGRRAAAVREAVRPRVEKVREASMGVLEGAAEDSGLRFVLIAVALFVLFLIFLLLSNWLR